MDRMQRTSGTVGRGRVLASAVVLGLVLGLVGVAAPTTAAADEPVYAWFETSLSATGDDGSCDAQFGLAGSHHCSGTYVSPIVAPFANGNHGQARWNHPEGQDALTLDLDVSTATMEGTMPNLASNALSITSGSAPWGADLHTPDLPGVTPGNEGGPLAIKVESSCDGGNPPTCGATIDVEGWLLVTRGEEAPEPNGTAEWRPFSLQIVTNGFPQACNADFGVPGTVACNGAFNDTRSVDLHDVPTTWPFAGTDGTMITNAGPSGGTVRVDFFVPGAELLGQIPDRTSSRYSVTSARVPWGTVVPVADDPGKAPGSKGGPLYIDARTEALGLTQITDVSGWLLVEPNLTGGTPTTSSSTPRPTTSIVTAAIPVTVSPRFTG